MDIFLGMIVFLQVFALLQNMLAHRQMLQKIKKQEKQIEEFLKQIQEEKQEQEEDDVFKIRKAGENYSLEGGQVHQTEEEKQKTAQEALINEVLSEVFS